MKRPLVLENRDFGRLWFGQVLSQSGTRMYQLAITWWIVSSGRVNAGTIAGIFLLIGAVPPVLFVRRIGKLVDSFRTKPLMLVADGLNSLVVAGTALALFFWPSMPLPVLYAAGFAIATLQAITDPGFGKSVSQLVAPERVGEATAFQTSALSLGFFFGAGVGGMLIPLLGVAGVIAVNAVTYLVSFVCIASARFRFEPTVPAANPAKAKEATLSAWRILEGYPLFKKLLVGMGIINFFTVPTFIILPLYVSRVLQASPATLGWIESGIWLGILAGTFLASRIRLSENPETLGALCCLVLAMGLLAPGLVVHSGFFFTMTLLQGTAFAFIPVRFIGLFQEGIPLEAKGRCFALMSAMFAATPPLSQLTAGFLADRLPITSLCLLQGAGALLVSLFFLTPNFFGIEPLHARTENAL